MLELLIFALVNIEPWMQFGLAGVTFITLATLLWRLSARLDKRDKDTVNVDVMMRVREETLREVNKRDEYILELTEKMLTAMNKSSNALQKVAQRLDDISTYLEEKDEEEKNS